MGLDTVRPVQWYYEYTTVTLIWSQNRLIYRVQLPVVGPSNWHYVRINCWPVPIGKWQSTLVLPMDFLRNTETGEINISPSCSGVRPRVCKIGLVSHAMQQPCLAQMTDAKPSYDVSCPLKLARRPAFDMVYPRSHNEYIISTAGVKLLLLCYDKAAETVSVNAGVYCIHLEHPCRLQGLNWTLTSIFQRSLNISLFPKQEPIQLNMSFASLLSERLNVDPFAFNLPNLGPVERTQIHIGNLTQASFTPDLPNPSNMLYYLCLLILFPLVGAAVYRGRPSLVDVHPQQWNP